MKILKPRVFLDGACDENSDWISDKLVNSGVRIVYGNMAISQGVKASPSKLIFDNLSLRGFWLPRYMVGLTEKEWKDIHDEVLRDVDFFKPKVQMVVTKDGFVDGVKKYLKDMSAGKVIVDHLK